MVQTILLLPPLQFLRREPRWLKLHSIFYISECMQHVFHDQLATMQNTLSLEPLVNTFSHELVILTKSRQIWRHEQWSSLSHKDDHVFVLQGGLVQLFSGLEKSKNGLWFFHMHHSLAINPQSLPFSVYLTRLQRFLHLRCSLKAKGVVLVYE